VVRLSGLTGTHIEGGKMSKIKEVMESIAGILGSRHSHRIADPDEGLDLVDPLSREYNENLKRQREAGIISTNMLNQPCDDDPEEFWKEEKERRKKGDYSGLYKRGDENEP
jgi:hypothetical protein